MTVSLEAEVPVAGRSDAITSVLDRDSGGDSDAFLAPQVTIRAKARLPKGVEALLEIENARLRADLFDTTTWGSAANRDVPGGSDDFEATLEQAWVGVNPFLSAPLSFRIGMQDFRLSLRGPGDAFFVDLLESEPALVTPVTEAARGGSLYGAAAPEGTDPSTAGLFRDTTDAGGARLTWNILNKSLAWLDLFYFTVLEGGVEHRDERFYGANLDILIPITEDAPSLASLIFAGIENDATGTRIWTTGISIDIRPASPAGLSVYLETYAQFGLFAEPDDHRIRQEAYAGRIGVAAPLATTGFKPSIDASFWVLTGDRGDPADHANHDFVSYENIDDALVVEDDLYGLDIDSNYMAFKLRFNASTKLVNEGDLRFSLLYAWFRLWREPEKSGGTVELDPGRRLGHEIDLRVTWDISEKASLSLFGGTLLGSQWLASKDAFDTGHRRAYITGFQVLVTF